MLSSVTEPFSGYSFVKMAFGMGGALADSNWTVCLGVRVASANHKMQLRN